MIPSSIPTISKKKLVGPKFLAKTILPLELRTLKSLLMLFTIYLFFHHVSTHI